MKLFMMINLLLLYDCGRYRHYPKAVMKSIVGVDRLAWKWLLSEIYIVVSYLKASDVNKVCFFSTHRVDLDFPAAIIFCNNFTEKSQQVAANIVQGCEVSKLCRNKDVSSAHLLTR